MRWFVVLGILVGVYYFLMISTVNTALDQTIEISHRYENFAAEAEQIAAGVTTYNR